MKNPESVFADLIRYNEQDSPFVDRYSQFGVVFEDGAPIGPGTVQVRSTILHQPVADSLLTLWVSSGSDRGSLVPVTRRRLDCFPWATYETGSVCGDDSVIDVDVRHAFLDERRMLSTFALSSVADQTIRVCFVGRFSEEQRNEAGVLRRFGLDEAPNRCGYARIVGDTIEGGLESSGTDHLPSPSLRIRRVAGFEAAAVIATDPHWMRLDSEWGKNSTREEDIDAVQRTAVYYEFDAGELELRAGDRNVVSFTTELSVSTYRHTEHIWADAMEIPEIDTAIELSRAAFLDRVRVSQPPRVESLRSDRAWRARWALTRTGYQARGPAGDFGEHIASTCVPSSAAFTRAFFWDALFTSAALARFEPEFARGAILTQFVRQNADGYCPEHGFNYHVSGRTTVGAPQAPVAAWAVDKYLRANPDDNEFLEQAFPILERNHRYWELFSDRDRDGLAEWSWSGQTADNSPLWDEIRPSELTGGCNWLPPIASVQLNSFLYRDATHMAEFAAKLGMDAAVARYSARATAVGDALMNVCYLPDERRFWDYNHATGRHTRIRTFYMCWPIWAGIPVPVDTKRDLIENVLLDPQQFFGPVPFPSVAYDEPTYDPGGYWRGRAWPQITYWLLEMLSAEGYSDAADEAARRFLSVYDRERQFPENMSTKPSARKPGGAPDYNWGIAAYDLIATGAYRRYE